MSIYTGVNGEDEEERDIKRLHIGARAYTKINIPKKRIHDLLNFSLDFTHYFDSYSKCIGYFVTLSD